MLSLKGVVLLRWVLCLGLVGWFRFLLFLKKKKIIRAFCQEMQYFVYKEGSPLNDFHHLVPWATKILPHLHCGMIKKNMMVLLVLLWSRLALVGNQDDSGIFRNTKHIVLPCLLFSLLNKSFIFDVQPKEVILERLSSQKPDGWIVTFKATWRTFLIYFEKTVFRALNPLWKSLQC